MGGDMQREPEVQTGHRFGPRRGRRQSDDDDTWAEAEIEADCNREYIKIIIARNTVTDITLELRKWKWKTRSAELQRNQRSILIIVGVGLTRAKYRKASGRSRLFFWASAFSFCPLKELLLVTEHL